MRPISCLLAIAALSLANCAATDRARFEREMRDIENKCLIQEQAFGSLADKLPIAQARARWGDDGPSLDHLNNKSFASDTEIPRLRELFAKRSNCTAEIMNLFSRYNVNPLQMMPYTNHNWRVNQLRAALIDKKISYGTYNELGYSSFLDAKKEEALVIQGAQQKAAEMESVRSSQALQMLQLGSQMLSSPQTSPLNSGPRTYNMNGRMVTCTTTGTVTNCF